MSKYFLIKTIFICFNVYAELSCTNDNGTRVVFVNGVMTKRNEAEETVNNIRNILTSSDTIKKTLDKNGNVFFGYVYNESLGLWDDVVELRNQVMYDLNNKDRALFYVEDVLFKNLNFLTLNPQGGSSEASKASIMIHNENVLQSGEKLRKALLELSRKTNVQLGNDYNDYLKKNKIVKKDYNSQLEIILKRAYYDVKTVDMVSSRMTAILTGKVDPNKPDEVFKKSKLILVPHSAGNQVVKSAYDRVFHYSDETYMNRQEKLEAERFLGVLNIASPSSESTLKCLRNNGLNLNCKNEAIKLDFDFIIQGANYVVQPREQYSMEPNFKLDKLKSASSFVSKSFSDLISFDRSFLPSFSSFLSGVSMHGMNEIYLSKYVNATEKGSNVSETMENIFIRKLASVAESLPSNCGKPDAKISGPTAETYYPRDLLTFSAEGSIAYESTPSVNEELEYYWTAVPRVGGEVFYGRGKSFSFEAPAVSRTFTLGLTVVNKAGESSSKSILIQSKPRPFTSDLFSYSVQWVNSNTVRIYTSADCDSGPIVGVIDIYAFRTASSFIVCDSDDIGRKDRFVEYNFGADIYVDYFYFHRRYDERIYFEW